MSVSEIVIDPITVMQMTNYFQKNIPNMGGATFGLLYARQDELRFNISLTAPLGTDNNSLKELLERAEEFETIRKIKSKTTESFLLEYELVGLCLMRKQYEKEEKKLAQLSNQYAKRGAPFTLIAVVEADKVSSKFLKHNKPYPYISEMHKNEKICLDSLHEQHSRSLVGNTVKKQARMIKHFDEKLSQLLNKLKQKKLQDFELVRLAEILDNYDRIKHENQGRKAKTIEAINYSVLVGLSINRLNNQ